jgi:hypothetical protein
VGPLTFGKVFRLVDPDMRLKKLTAHHPRPQQQRQLWFSLDAEWEYGIWYPHHQSYKSYLRALINQLKGTVLSMKIIREVRPEAQLIQTEEFGFTSGTKVLEPICSLLNQRRWLPIDLLCGLVDEQHPMFTYMLSRGISAREILWFQENPCPPDVLGINYYVTSDRFLDHRIDEYPPDRVSAEGAFVDIEAVRVRSASGTAA